MSAAEELLTEDRSLWIEALPTYQKKRIESVLSNGKGWEEAAEVWLSASIDNTFPFGAGKSKGLFLEKVWEEIYKYLCDPESYSDEKKKMAKEGNVTHALFVGAVSAAIAPSLGTSAVFIAPVVALLLASMGKIALNAWCETKRISIEDAKSKT
jgi:hypothetical protein